MNFEATNIVIRERGFGEIMDLALKVARAHAGPLLAALLVGAAPWAVVNALVFNAMVSENPLFDDSASYVVYMVIAVVVEAPLATAPLTLYLGQATFADHVHPRRIARDFVRSLPQLALLQGVVRVLAAPMVVTLAVPFIFWPYLSELILLERNPLLRGKAKRLTTLRRSRALHRGAGGDLFGRWLASAAAGAALVAALAAGVHTMAAQLFSEELSKSAMLCYVFPAALWLVVGVLTVVRFLAYLDLRIRNEGWEVELKMRSEAARLAKGLA